MNRALAVLIFLCFSSVLFARETKEQKREHTHNLRRWFQLIEFTFDDKLPEPLAQERVKEMDERFKLIVGKLSKKKQASLTELYRTYRGARNLKKEVRAQSLMNLRAKTFKFFRVITTPAQIPSFKLGQKLYQEHCVSCHGVSGRGDGLFTKNPSIPMMPLPKDFKALYEGGLRSPYSYFNTLLIGSPGTAMVSYDKSMKSHDLWSLSFYLSTGWQSGSSSEHKGLPMEQLSELTNYELRKSLKGQQSESKLRYLRQNASFSSDTPRN